MGATTLAIIALLPGRLGRWLNELRGRLDPERTSSLPPHLPIIGPFEAEPSFLPLEQHCWDVCHRTAPFSVELGELIIDEDELIACLPVLAGQDRLLALREALLTGKYAPPRDANAYEPRAVVGPLVHRDELTRWDEASATLDLSFLLERIELMAQYPDGAWYQRDFYTLDRAVTRA